MFADLDEAELGCYEASMSEDSLSHDFIWKQSDAYQTKLLFQQAASSLCGLESRSFSALQ